MTTELWQHTGEPGGGFYDDDSDLPGMPYGQLVRLRREEARLAAEEARRHAEAQERSDLRQALAVRQARAYTLEKGLAWDEREPFKHTPSVIDRANALFALQDAQMRATELSALTEAGLAHLATQLLGVPSPTPGAQLEPATPGSATGGVPTMEAPDTTSPAVRARNALRRWRADARARRRADERSKETWT